MKKLTIYLTLLLASCFVSATHGQTFKQYLSEAEKAYKIEDYYAAMHFYSIAYDIKEERTDLLYQYAESARRLNAFVEADSSYQLVISKDTANQFPNALYYLATVKKQLGQYEAAAEHFLEYAANPYSDPLLAAKAREEGENICPWALEQYNNPIKALEVNQLDGAVNTQFSEFSAVPYQQGLLYTSFSVEPKRDLYDPPRPLMKVFERKETRAGDQAEIINIDSVHTAHTAFNSDFSRVYFSRCDYIGYADMRCQLYYRDLQQDGRMGDTILLPETINIPGYSASQPNVGVDEASGQELLFFVSNRPEGKGKTDIWYSIINESGGFSIPMPVEAVNTEEEEATPFFHSSTQQLFFSSKGWWGLGGFDLFKAAKVGDAFAAPQNLGVPYNSYSHDISIYLNEDESKGYIASNRKGSVHFEDTHEYCCYDIYEVNQPIADLEIELFACDHEQDVPLYGADVRLFEVGPGGQESLLAQLTSTTHIYEREVERGKKYRVKAQKEGFIGAEFLFDLTRPNLDLNTALRLSPMDIRLEVSIFDDNVEYDTALLNSTIQLFENGEEIAVDTKEDSNEFSYTINRNKEYMLIASKAAYHADTVVLDLSTLGQSCTYVKRMELAKKKISEYTPLYLYFHNNSPDKGWRKTTNKTYQDAYKEYMSMKDTYVSEFTEVLSKEDSLLALLQVSAFFKREVEQGYYNLREFLTISLDFLNAGIGIEITVRGFASPRASSAYNEVLTLRRIDCLKNEFEQFDLKEDIDTDDLQKHLDSGLLRIIEVPVGEAQANQIVSDALDDVRNSIYSPLASRERRVEIIGVTLDNQNQ